MWAQEGEQVDSRWKKGGSAIDSLKKQERRQGKSMDSKGTELEVEKEPKSLMAGGKREVATWRWRATAADRYSSGHAKSSFKIRKLYTESLPLK